MHISEKHKTETEAFIFSHCKVVNHKHWGMSSEKQL